MIAIGLLFIRMLCDCFKPQQRLEAEILVLRHQLNVLQQPGRATGEARTWRPKQCEVKASVLKS